MRDLRALGRRAVEAAFDAGAVTSEAGLPLRWEVSTSLASFEQVAECFTAYRTPERAKHTVTELVAQRVLTLARGYEDLNDHD